MVTEGRMGVPVVRNENKGKENEDEVAWKQERNAQGLKKGQHVEIEKGSRKNEQETGVRCIEPQNGGKWGKWG